LENMDPILMYLSICSEDSTNESIVRVGWWSEKIWDSRLDSDIKERRKSRKWYWITMV
jgi:hypothetical protein